MYHVWGLPQQAFLNMILQPYIETRPNIDYVIPSAKLLQAPYRWRHAGLSEVQDFLRQELAAGRFHPESTEGLF